MHYNLNGVFGDRFYRNNSSLKKYRLLESKYIRSEIYLHERFIIDSSLVGLVF